ncbi:MAG: metalloregulator ArsR/SmtB family transcription factor [candidate division WOR-3 bacterium]|jgi:ArsR family transcriptional regulator, arsenate/arsenite/antimonite-responsive transcriptional repressor
MEKVVKMLGALSDMTRLKIYLLLLEDELCVCELENILDIEQSRISHGLRVLREADLVDSQREGKWIIYFANPKAVENEILKGLKKEVSLTASDQRRIIKCKRESTREKCGV